MSARSKIVDALVAKFKLIDGTTPYSTNIYGNAFAQNKFWDEVIDFPCIYVVAGSEIREYLPADFKWGYINVSLKCYHKGERPEVLLETLLEDIETCIDSNRILVYDTGKETTEILITSIVTDEGLLVPYGVAEVTLNIRYQVL
jgi:hypothetical protein